MPPELMRRLLTLITEPGDRFTPADGPAALAGKSHARIPEARSVVIAARSVRLASLRGTRAMLVGFRWQTDRVLERDLLVVTEEPLNAETKLDRQSGITVPAGRHYVRTHFKIPEGSREVRITGAVHEPRSVTLDAVRTLPSRTLAVTLECAGNGRKFLEPPAPGEQWGLGAVGTAEWTGAALHSILEGAPLPSAVEILFRGADEGVPKDLGKRIAYERSLPLETDAISAALTAWAAEGVDHVQLGLSSATRASFAIVLAAIARHRSAS